MQVLSNYRMSSDGEKQHFRGLDEIRVDLRKLTDGWPRKIAGALFVPAADARAEGFCSLTTVEEFKAWLARVVKLRWARSEVDNEGESRVQAISLENLFHDLRMRPFETYRSIERYPQFPHRDGVYYLEHEERGGDGKALAEFMGMLNAASEQDRDLLEALLLTLFCGIGPGERPSFVLTSDHGKGVGKTATAEAVVAAAGGAIQPDPNEPVNRIMESFFTVESMGKRAVLVDNLKGVLGLSTIERLITSRAVEGHWLRQGRVTRENLLTWVFTANMPKMSADLSQRSVVVKIGPRKNGFDFNGWFEAFMRERRAELVGDCLAMLRSEERHAIRAENQGRFGAWEQAVLRLFPNANELAMLIRRRKGDVDADADAADTLLEEIKERLEEVGLDPHRQPVVIQWGDVARMIERAWRESSVSAKAAGSMVRQMMGFGPLACVSENRARGFGRGIVVFMGAGEERGPLVAYERPTGRRGRHLNRAQSC